jgi:hypothetical protein
MFRIFERCIAHSFRYALLMLPLLAQSVQAAVNIGSDPTKNMNCSNGVCSPTAKDAVLNVNDLTDMLASGDVSVTTGARAVTIGISAPFSWASGHKLTLDAKYSIHFRAAVTVAGSGALTLVTNDGRSGGELVFFSGGKVDFWDLSSSLVVDGHSFTLVDDIRTLAARIAAQPGGFYALAADIDAKHDGTYGRSPIDVPFRGALNGLGHAILHLSIRSREKRIAFFVKVASGGVLEDLNLIDAHVVGLTASGRTTVAGLVGQNRGTLKYLSSLNIKIEGHPAENFGINLGGLVGGNQGTIAHCLSTGTLVVDGVGIAAGLAAGNTGTITDSSATVTVSSGSQGWAAGLVGGNSGTVENSFSSGSTQIGTGGYTGGLVAENNGVILASHSSATVVGPSVGPLGWAGGLVGFNFSGGLVSKSFATGSVTAAGDQSNVGGLAGAVGGGTIDQSFSTGDVSAGSHAKAGGLVGYHADSSVGPGTISNSYAAGAVMAGNASAVGGLVGRADIFEFSSSTVNSSYSVGKVAGPSFLGGFLGYDGLVAGSIAKSYWDLDTSNIDDPSRGAGNIANDPGITGLTDVQLKSGLPDGFDPAVWGQNPNINNGYPYLLANPPPN